MFSYCGKKCHVFLLWKKIILRLLLPQQQEDSRSFNAEASSDINRNKTVKVYVKMCIYKRYIYKSICGSKTNFLELTGFWWLNHNLWKLTSNKYGIIMKFIDDLVKPDTVTLDWLWITIYCQGCVLDLVFLDLVKTRFWELSILLWVWPLLCLIKMNSETPASFQGSGTDLDCPLCRQIPWGRSHFMQLYGNLCW